MQELPRQHDSIDPRAANARPGLTTARDGRHSGEAPARQGRTPEGCKEMLASCSSARTGEISRFCRGGQGRYRRFLSMRGPTQILSWPAGCALCVLTNNNEI